MHPAPNTLSATEMMAPGINSLAEALSASTAPATPINSSTPSNQALPSNSYQSPTFTTSIKPSFFPITTTSTQSPSTFSAPAKSDADSIQDIFASSGINLREEAEAITREQESLTCFISPIPTGEDPRSKISSLFNIENFSFLISTIGKVLLFI